MRVFAKVAMVSEPPEFARRLGKTATSAQGLLSERLGGSRLPDRVCPSTKQRWPRGLDLWLSVLLLSGSLFEIGDCRVYRV